MLHFLVLSTLGALATEDWTALQPPSMCRTGVRVPAPSPLLDGAHLRQPQGAGPENAPESGALLPYATFMQMLEEDARARGTKLEIQRQSGSTLVRGDAAAIAAARAFIADLERSSRALDVELSVVLNARNGEKSAGALTLERRVRSGETVFLGLRETRSYVASFDVEVAADSGSSEPVVGHALFGRGLHLRAVRVDGGKRVFVWGLLDLAELAALPSFDPGTPDLGVIQQPHVQFVQAAFAGVVESGRALELSITGSGLAAPDVTLAIQARTTPDPESGASDGSEERGFAVLDLSFLADDVPVLLDCAPGTGLPSEARAKGGDPAPPVLPPSALASMVEGARGPAGRNSRAQLYWSDRLLFVPRSDAAAVREAKNLVRGLESARLSTGRLEISAGALKASLPVCVAAPARLLAGAERSYLVDYRLEIAPQIWMPAPTVETAFDGLCVDVQPAETLAACALWSAASGPVQEIAREEAQVGKLQLLARNLRSGAVQLMANAKESTAIDLDGNGGAIRLRFAVP